jgi:hypothetical protein
MNNQRIENSSRRVEVEEELGFSMVWDWVCSDTVSNIEDGKHRWK